MRALPNLRHLRILSLSRNNILFSETRGFRAGVPGVGPALQRGGPVPRDADHHARLPPAELHLQRVQLHAESDAGRVRGQLENLRGNRGGKSLVGETV